MKFLQLQALHTRLTLEGIGAPSLKLSAYPPGPDTTDILEYHMRQGINPSAGGVGMQVVWEHFLYQVVRGELPLTPARYSELLARYIEIYPVPHD